MNSTPVISIVVPVYNAEKYIGNTLRNIVFGQFQDFDSRRWELIVVNDGSTDSSLKIIREFAEAHPNIAVIDKPNSGAADSRNVGLAIAKGDYVYFFDSDDLMPAKALPAICAIAQTACPDLIKFNFRHISPAEYAEYLSDLPSACIADADVKAMSVAEYLNQTQAMTTPPGDCTTLTVYRRALLTENTLSYNPDILIGEDVDLIWRAMFCSKSIVYINQDLYFYHLNAQSTSHISDPQKRLTEYSALLQNMLAIRSSYMQRPDMISEGATTGLGNTIRYLSNLVLSLQVICRTPLGKIRQTMRNLKKAGVDIHPGRPRLDASVKSFATTSAKLRRWLVAYILVLPIWIKK